MDNIIFFDSFILFIGFVYFGVCFASDKKIKPIFVINIFFLFIPIFMVRTFFYSDMKYDMTSQSPIIGWILALSVLATSAFDFGFFVKKFYNFLKNKTKID